MVDVQSIVDSQETPTVVANDQQKPEYKKSYIEIAENLHNEDPLINALLHDSELQEDEVISPWLLGEFKTLLDMSKTLKKEMGLNFIMSRDTKKLYMDENVRIGTDGEIAGGALMYGVSYPSGYLQVIDTHTHVASENGGNAGFSKFKHCGDWNNILNGSDLRMANIVVCDNNKMYITIPKKSIFETAAEYYKGQDKYSGYYVRDFCEEFYTKYEVTSEMNNDERVNENIRIAKAFNISLFEADLDTGKIHILN